MEEIKPSRRSEDVFKNGRRGNSGVNSFDPLSHDGIVPRCICGYVLHKSDENIWTCDGGNHRYRMEDGTMEMDKFGRVVLAIPDDQIDASKKK